MCRQSRLFNHYSWFELESDSDGDKAGVDIRWQGALPIKGATSSSPWDERSDSSWASNIFEAWQQIAVVWQICSLGGNVR